jgi:hypothetical protein
MNKILLALTVATLSFHSRAHDHAHGEDNLEDNLTEAPVVLAGIAAIEEFKAGFEANGSTLNSELVGFSSKSNDGDAAVAVYNIPQSGKLQNTDFDCHYHAHGDKIEWAHCHNVGSSSLRDYVAAQGTFSVDEFRDAARNAVGIFKRSLGNPASIEYAKFWRSYQGREANIQASFIWKKSDGSQAINFFYCHKHRHGDEIEVDCHRQRSAGPNEP